MSELTGKERMTRILNREPVDRISLHESLWPETSEKWYAEGRAAEGETFEDHFNMDLHFVGAFNFMADVDNPSTIIEEDEETQIIRNGNGALLRFWKNKSGTPEHVDFLVKDRSGWEEHVRPHLVNTDLYEKRIKFDEYREARKEYQQKDRFLCCTLFNVFESMATISGHEYTLMGMALDPDWIRDMCEVHVDMAINLCEILFEREGMPDGIWTWEDMGFKDKPFMSPQMYKEIIQPSHKRLFDYWHSKGLKNIVHSCGYVAPLVPSMIEAGMDCLQAMEVKAGMDLVELKKNFGDKIAFMGGMDVRPMVSNDRDAIVAELKKKLPAAMAGGGYTLQSDHSIPPQVEYETYKFFVETGLEMGKY